MVQPILVVSDNRRDNITMYTKEAAFVGIAKPSDKKALIFIDDSLITSTWTGGIISSFFGREKGHLEKSQLDYLETLPIREFCQTSFKVTNHTDGNSSWID